MNHMFDKAKERAEELESKIKDGSGERPENGPDGRQGSQDRVDDEIRTARERFQGDQQ